jgi:hypothetical protein
MSETGASLGGQPQRKFAGAGGTPGGVGEFFIGLGVAGIGFYLLFNHVYVQTSFGHPSGFGVFGNSFGLTVLPLLFGIGTLFVNGKSILGWALTAGGLLFIAAGILMNMHIYFRATTLFDALVMFGLIAAGFGLIVKSLRPHKVKRVDE